MRLRFRFSLSLHACVRGLFCLALQDFCTDHKSRLSALEQHREVARAVTAAHATLQKAQTALTDALQVCVSEREADCGRMREGEVVCAFIYKCVALVCVSQLSLIILKRTWLVSLRPTHYAASETLMHLFAFLVLSFAHARTRTTQTNWRRSAKFKPVLAPLIADAHANLTALGTSLTFAALEVDAADRHHSSSSSAPTVPTPAGDQHSQQSQQQHQNQLQETELLLLRGDRAFFGHGAPRDYDAAFAAYERAARAGSARAMNSAAHMLRLGLGRHADADAAVAWCVDVCCCCCLLDG